MKQQHKEGESITLGWGMTAEKVKPLAAVLAPCFGLKLEAPPPGDTGVGWYLVIRAEEAEVARCDAGH